MDRDRGATRGQPLMATALKGFLRRLRRPDAAEVAALRAYESDVGPALDRLHALHDEWLEATREDIDQARLANRAAVSRWEAGRLSEELEQRTERLAAVEDEHRRVAAEVRDAARAFQLLAHGTRFHKADAVCDGQVLLVGAVERLGLRRAEWGQRLARARD